MERVSTTPGQPDDDQRRGESAAAPLPCRWPESEMGDGYHYIWVDGGWLYLATVMDLYSRAIVGWKLDTSMTEKLAMDALRVAFANRDVQPGLIIHSDRGVQSRALKYLDLVRSKNCLPSISRQGNFWNSAVMESFYSCLKVELIYAEQYTSIEAVRSGIFEYIEIFYNRKRRHSALGNISPAELERRCA